MFDTKIAIVIRDDLATWQKLNVTAFLTSGIIAQSPEIIGETYRDADGNVYNPMSRQPIVVLGTDLDMLRKIQKRALERQLTVSAYIEEMFETGHDVANRSVFSKFNADNAKLVGIALRADKKIVDKVAKGAKMHLDIANRERRLRPARGRTSDASMSALPVPVLNMGRSASGTWRFCAMTAVGLLRPFITRAK